jgi:hypothetical protein
METQIEIIVPSPTATPTAPQHRFLSAVQARGIERSFGHATEEGHSWGTQQACVRRGWVTAVRLAHGDSYRITTLGIRYLKRFPVRFPENRRVLGFDEALSWAAAVVDQGQIDPATVDLTDPFACAAALHWLGEIALRYTWQGADGPDIDSYAFRTPADARYQLDGQTLLSLGDFLEANPDLGNEVFVALRRLRPGEAFEMPASAAAGWTLLRTA